MPTLAMQGQEEEQQPKLSSAAGTTLGGYSSPGATQQEKSSGLFTDAGKYLKAADADASMRSAQNIRQGFEKDKAAEMGKQTELQGKFASGQADYQKRLSDWNAKTSNMGASNIYRDQVPWTGNQQQITQMKQAYQNAQGGVQDTSQFDNGEIGARQSALDNLRRRATSAGTIEGMQGLSSAPGYTGGIGALDTLLMRNNPEALKQVKSFDVGDVSKAQDALTGLTGSQSAYNKAISDRQAAANADAAKAQEYWDAVSGQMKGGSNPSADRIARANALRQIFGLGEQDLAVSLQPGQAGYVDPRSNLTPGKPLSTPSYTPEDISNFDINDILSKLPLPRRR